jgi:hypothetical protein
VLITDDRKFKDIINFNENKVKFTHFYTGTNYIVLATGNFYWGCGSGWVSI